MSVCVTSASVMDKRPPEQLSPMSQWRRVIGASRSRRRFDATASGQWSCVRAAVARGTLTSTATPELEASSTASPLPSPGSSGGSEDGANKSATESATVSATQSATQSAPQSAPQSANESATQSAAESATCSSTCSSTSSASNVGANNVGAHNGGSHHSAAILSFRQRLSPILIIACANFMATLWEDLINERPRASDDAGWEVCFKLINAMGVTLLIGTPLRLATLRWVEWSSRKAVLLTCWQTLTGWMWKAFVASAIEVTQGALAKRREGGVRLSSTPLSPPSSPPSSTLSSSLSLYAGCWAVCLGVGVLLVTPLCLSTGLLPATERLSLVRGGGWRGKVRGCLVLYLGHASAHLIGAAALPLGYGWFRPIVALLRVPDFLVTHRATRIGSSVSLRILGGLVLALALGAAESHLERRFAACARRAARRGARLAELWLARTERLLSRAFEYLLALVISNISKSLWVPRAADASATCYRLNDLMLVRAHWAWILALCWLLILGLAAVLVAWRQPDPWKLCGGRIRLTLALSLVVSTLGIMMGWAVKDLYDAVVEHHVERHGRARFTIAAVSFSVLTFVFLVAHDLYFKPELKRRRARRAMSSFGDAERFSPCARPIGLPSESRVTLRPRRRSQRSWARRQVGGARGLISASLALSTVPSRDECTERELPRIT